ncbi:MAG TPA: hypothetical protein VFH28_09635 [Nitrososphaera sp.]|nr:hypothetical protein [Nitrososphaera sp.]
MNDKIMLGLLVVAGLIGTTVAAPALAQALESFLIIEKAEVSANGELEATLTTEGVIPTDGSEGAFGYGILTEDGDAILVTTTHAGVLDSEEQNYILDATWHNHFVRLGDDVAECGEDQGVVDITWQSPGEVEINDNIASISGVPTDEFEGWHSITGEDLSMTLGEDVSNVVSFRLDPVFDEQDGLQAVCVTDIMPAEDIDVNSIAQPQQPSDPHTHTHT